MNNISALTSPKINFLIIAPVYIDGNTGSSGHLRGVVTGLSINHNVHVIASSIDPGFTRSNFKRVVYKRGIYSIITYCQLIYLSLYNLIFKKIDVIYERENIFIAGTILGKLFRKHVILEVNGLNKETLSQQNKNVLMISFIHYISIINIKMASDIIVGSSKLKQILIDSYHINESKINVIENGANINIFKPINNAKEILHLNYDGFHIGFVGTLAEWQGIENLIDAAALVISRIPNTYFLIVGGLPNEVEKYKRLAETKKVSDNFVFFGQIPYVDIPLYINSFDLCITLKMEMESGYSPTKLYEYMACGKPIVASDTHGHKTLEEYKAGILVDPNNPNNVSEAIIELYNNKLYREELGNNGIKAINEKYNWERVASDIERVYMKKILG